MSDTSTKLFSNHGITASTRFIHTPGEDALSGLLYVQEVGVLKSLRPHKSSREGLDSFLFMIIRSGDGFVRIKDKEHAVKEGDCVLINCMEKYEHESSEDNPWELSWVHFNGINAKLFYKLFLKENKENIFTPSETESYVKMIENLMALCNDKDVMSEVYANETLVELLTEVISDVTKKEVDDADIDLGFVRTWINDNYASDDSIKEVCEKIEKDAASVEKAFTDAYGISPEEYLKIRRLNVAKEMLRFTIEPEDVIAKECGFDSYETFVKIFEDAESMKPSDYRSKWAQWIK